MRYIFVFGSLLLVNPGLLRAGTFTYTSSLLDWTGVGYAAPSTYDFESASTAGLATSFISLGGYSFSASGNSLKINSGAPAWVGAGNYLMTYDTGYSLTVNNSGVYAIGFNVGCAFCGAGTPVTSITATDKDGNTYVSTNIATASNAPAAFWGISSTSELTQIQFNFGTTYFGIDNIVSGGQPSSGGSGGGDPGDTPEVATAVLIATGLFFMARYRRQTVHPSTA